MARFVSVLISQAHQRLLGVLLWVGVFLIVLFGGMAFGIFQIDEAMRRGGDWAMRAVSDSSAAVQNALAEMHHRLTMEPCSPEFHSALRQIAYLPDGLNVLLYVKDGKVICSNDEDFPGVELGVADQQGGGNSVYFDHDLGFLGLEGTGNILIEGNFGLVAPLPSIEFSNTAWLGQSFALMHPGGPMHRSGDPAVTEAYRNYLANPPPLPLLDGVLFNVACDGQGIRCIITRGQLYVAAANGLPLIVFWTIVSALLSLGVSDRLHGAIKRFWSFEARFLRHFNADSVICVYQPILDLESGQIVGCEVLARWRDVDGATVFPDRFLPVLEKNGLTRALTQFVVQRAFADLSTLTLGKPLQVSFNVAPSDLDAQWLQQALDPFEREPDRFQVIVEIIESEAVELDLAQREIERLRRHGIRTHLDDFGTGYSNIQNLATLALDGVKLDRSFAMAAPGSLIETMMFSTIEMIHAAGHRIIVEGVETEARLHDLRATGHVQFVQGYLISRPLDIDKLGKFLSSAEPVAWRPRLVA